ncbi:LysR family transcriptional regulator [Bradyrhizobium sp. U87765 SZCCT0131]|uniref:LysR family transcriptional regulator n=1 Tax=unclassified Bradyrhizobium TaxID=2631580 RepID=UPI001BA535A5|nr:MULTISPECIES: LysR family transcriptional regulator [unclassified Bradyrhizobium]MBR1222357.1 LysR family transcriptional regulator [Bradyrhizobium sp. U87765 SZCCT0131]MBR1264159.1 LysR family transcriptional regulator [Bradyrhizobium sp. U87765 SZCCT0134]MBR1308058.1 LysR family transcriptional regulator [Bradyrhizobium sp. U87765 SZCCT0110]MBR1320409.1 LysR family transcriptional regulator [Bradyrhizobium sp. U87765 SZCCT0109]MBR1348478.1 LysR family transcriptional regulator [Bradyrhizo
MSKIDHLALDGHALKLFLAVLEEGSVTAAATRLGLTQSAVSHSLQKLRRIVGDPLFAKSGRGIVATAHAHALAARARTLLDDMRQFAGAATFRPAGARLTLTIAANDFQRDLLLPGFFQRVEAAVASFSLRVIPSQSPSAAMLREGRCDLLITPLPPSGIDIVQKRLLQDHYVCFYDSKVRAAPATRAAYLAARHITVVYTDNERLDFDRRLAAGGIRRDIAISVPNFSGVPAFLHGSDMLASMPSLLASQLMRDFAGVDIPLTAKPARKTATTKASTSKVSALKTRPLAELPMYMVWHQRFHKDPAHSWLREQLEASVTGARDGDTSRTKPR